MAKLSMLATIIGLAGAGLTHQGILNVMPRNTWLVIAAVASVLWTLTRRPSD